MPVRPSIFPCLTKASARLRDGGVVAIPTETVYGLAARIDRHEGIEGIFRLKRRPFFDPLIVHVASLEQGRTLVPSFPVAARALAERFWPGPLTIVLPHSGNIDPMICAGLDTVGVRCPAHPIARRLIRRAGAPLAAPSANIFSKTSPTTAEHVRLHWSADEVPVVDGGPCDVGLESTVVRVLPGDESFVELLRPGLIDRSALEAALSELPYSVEVRRTASGASPGNAEIHYRPSVPLVLLMGDGSPITPVLVQAVAERLQLPDPSGAAEIVLPREPVLASRILYSEMYRLAAGKPSFLVVTCPLDVGAGDAWEGIRDRLGRAASFKLEFRNSVLCD